MADSAPATADKLPKDLAAEKGMVNVQVDGNWIQVPTGTRMIEVCKMAEKEVPHYCYHTKLCLVQMTVGKTDYLIDSLALESLEALNILTENPNIVKVFHAGENDVPYFRRHGVEFKNIFDTHIAAKILELESKSLGGLVDIYFEINLPKDQSRADWRIRPLPPEQVEYARQDTLYLCELAEILQKELEEADSVQEAHQYFKSLEGLELREKSFDPDGWAKIKGARELSGLQRSILHELYSWREEVAEKEDLAVFRIAHNSALLSLSRKRFQQPDQLIGWAKNDYFRQDAPRLIELMNKGRERGQIDVQSTVPRKGHFQQCGRQTAIGAVVVGEQLALRNQCLHQLEEGGQPFGLLEVGDLAAQLVVHLGQGRMCLLHSLRRHPCLSPTCQLYPFLSCSESTYQPTFHPRG